jgi:hypothetical protein
MATRGDTYVSDVRASVRSFWESYQHLRSCQDEWNAQDYGNTLAGQLDPAGPNADVTAVQVGSAVFDAMNAVKTVMDAGHATNITNIL